MATDVAAVGAIGAADTAVATDPASTVLIADAFATVNLGEMIANRLQSGTSGSVGSGLGLGAGIGQQPGILRAATVSATTAGDVTTGSLDVPAVLRAYGNGRIPKEALKLIGIGQHRLWSAAADAFTSMRSAAAAAGVQIGVTDSYRSYDQQVQLAADKGLYSQGGFAAVPGTSPHGWGLAVDVDVDPTGLAWMRANGAQYGFVETTPREPWHWEYRGAT